MGLSRIWVLSGVGCWGMRSPCRSWMNANGQSCVLQLLSSKDAIEVSQCIKQASLWCVRLNKPSSSTSADAWLCPRGFSVPEKPRLQPSGCCPASGAMPLPGSTDLTHAGGPILHLLYQTSGLQTFFSPLLPTTTQTTLERVSQIKSNRKPSRPRVHTKSHQSSSHIRSHRAQNETHSPRRPPLHGFGLALL